MISARSILLFASALLFTVFGGSVLAQENGPTIEERREAVRRLPPEERTRLTTALERFRNLTPEQQSQLRAKADRVGAERLRDLSGRDFSSLRRTHERLREEQEQIFAIVTPARLAALTDADRAYLRSEALRGFQRHIKRRVLGYANYDLMRRDWEALPNEEKRARVDAGWRRIEDEALARMPAVEAARIRALPPAERREARQGILRDFRHAEALDFARTFDNARVGELLRRTPEERERIVTAWQVRARWFEATRVLGDGALLERSALDALSTLPPADMARVLLDVRETEDMEVTARRARLTELVNRLVGERAATPPELRRRTPALPQLLRERHQRRMLAPK